MTTEIGGTVVEFTGDMPQVGQEAPDFRYIKKDFSEGRLSEHRGENVMILCMPSLDTGTCAMETRTFNKRADELGATTLVVTMDLPFAMKRFCETEGIDKAHPASDFKYREFGDQYHMVMQNGPIAGVHARAIYGVDKNGVIQYTQLVPSIGAEPDYDAAIAAIQAMN